MRLQSLTALISSLAIVACADTPETTTDLTDVDHTSVDLDAARAYKADGENVSIRAIQGGHLVAVYGDLASELFTAMDDAGARRYLSGSTRYRVGSQLVCATRSDLFACNIYTRIVEDFDGFDFAIHGQRHNSAASELFGTLANAQGRSPATLSEVSLGRYVCGKTDQDVWCGATSDKPQQADTKVLTLDLPNLDPVGPDYVYEGWLITANGPVTSGRFDLDKGPTVSMEIDVDLAAASTMFVLTIEPAFNDDPAPAPTHVVAGPFNDGMAELGSDHPGALNTDFANASGGFILETPSTATVASDYNLGIWFLDPAAGPGAGLNLPELPAGWVYEGWVVTEGTGPLSTGRFTRTTGADSDGGGPAAGPDGTPPFPGQDFINPAVDVSSATIVISVEPEPDFSPAPFFLKPLVVMATDAGPGVFQRLDQNAAASDLRGLATFQ